MFLPKLYKSVIAINQICYDNISIVISILVFNSEYCICFVLWKPARESRCTVKGKHGLIRCPESNKCCECEYGASLEHKSSSTVSLDALLEDVAYEPADYSIPQEDRLIELLLEELIDYLEEIHPGYGSVFHLLCDGITNRREIGETLGVPTGTIKDWVPKIRRLAEEYYNRY